MRAESLTFFGPVTGNYMPKEGSGPGPESDPVRGEAWTKGGMGDDAAPASPAPAIERSRSMFLKVRPHP